MVTPIDFEAATDRDLLVITATIANETCAQLEKLNGTVAKHESRLSTVEGKANVLQAQTMDNRRLLNKAFIGAISGMGTTIIFLLTRTIDIW